jgi:hypothetical protein
MFRDAIGALSGRESRPDLGWLVTLAATSTTAAVALYGLHEVEAPHVVARKVWALTPEAGALNGEWEDWLFEKADQLGINPADLNRHLDPLDFRSALSIAVDPA